MLTHVVWWTLKPEAQGRNAAQTRWAPNTGILSGMSGIACHLVFPIEGP